jgi:hypothetical protein
MRKEHFKGMNLIIFADSMISFQETLESMSHFKGGT